jgi:hypothetical protein
VTGASLRAWTTAALVAVLGLTGCGAGAPAEGAPTGGSSASAPGSHSSPTGSPSEITDPDVAVALVAPRLRDGRFSAARLDYDRSTCLAEHIVDDLGPAAAVEFAGIERIGRFSGRQRAAISEALDACVPAREAAQRQVVGINEAFGREVRPDPTMVRCLTTEFEGRVGDLVLTEQRYAPGDAVPPWVAAAIGGCAPDDLWAEILAPRLEGPGVSGTEARCAAAVIADSVGSERLAALSIAPGDQPPVWLLEALRVAYGQCTTSGA